MFIRIMLAAAATIALAGCHTGENETYRSYPNNNYPNDTYQNNNTYPNSGANTSQSGQWITQPPNSNAEIGQPAGQISGQVSGQSSNQMGSQANTQVSDTDRHFVQTAATAGMFEVQAAKLALDRNVDSQTKQNARMLISDHQAANQELMNIGRRDNFNVPSDLQQDQQNKLDQLRNLTGSDFAQTYHQMQLQGHKDAIALFEQEASSGQNPDLRSFAQRTLPTLRKHLDHIQNNPVSNMNNSSDTNQNPSDESGDNDMEIPNTNSNP